MAKPRRTKTAKPAPAPAAKRPPTPAAQEPDYTLADVVQRLGDATKEEARLDLEGMSDAEFITKGSRVATPRLAKELARNYGVFADWLPKATKEQLKRLGFVNAEWLRIAAWAGRQAEIHHESLQEGAHGSTSDKALRTTNADTLGAEARQSRDELWSVLSYLSGNIAAWKTKIETAYAKSVTASPVADGILAMADVADTMLADKSLGMTARRKKVTLDADQLNKYREQAKKTIAAAKTAQAVSKTSAVKQSDVDFWDGIALTYFEQFVEAADRAHNADPSVPAASIIGLRSWFGRHSRKKSSGGSGSGNSGGGGGNG